MKKIKVTPEEEEELEKARKEGFTEEEIYEIAKAASKYGGRM
jgi:hypothetical protein